MVWSSIESTDQGANDVITATSGNNVILGGEAVDMITTGSGNDVLLGDNGVVGRGFAYTAEGIAYSNFYDVLTHYDAVNGGDTITTSGGSNWIIAGGNADTVNGGSGNDHILGDHGRLFRDSGLVVRVMESKVFDIIGANDVINGGTGGVDFIFGGYADDIITGSTADRNVLFGDTAVAVFEILVPTVFDLSSPVPLVRNGDDSWSKTADTAPGRQPRTLTSFHSQNIWSTDPANGGEDEIYGGRTDDIIVGGAMHDFTSANTTDRGNILQGNRGNDIIVGTNAYIQRDAAQTVLRIETIFEQYGSNDRINVATGLRPEASRGQNILIGGTGDDIIHGSWENISQTIVGDNAVVVRADGTNNANDVWTQHPEWGGRDILIGSRAGDLILGGTGGTDDTAIDNVFGDYTVSGGQLRVDVDDHNLAVGQVAYFEFDPVDLNIGILVTMRAMGSTKLLRSAVLS